jgi:Skp family chaperone for outer membrane proteins
LSLKRPQIGEKNIMKKIFAAALALVLILSVAGCSTAPSAGEGDTAVVDSDEAVATIGDRKVTFGEYKQLFDAYAQYYAMMGYDISTDEEGTKQLQDSIIDALVVNEIIAYQAAQSGYDKLSDEKLAEIEEQAAADLNSIVEEYRKQAESDAEADSGIDVEERLAEYIADEAEAYTGIRQVDTGKQHRERYRRVLQGGYAQGRYRKRRGNKVLV